MICTLGDLLLDVIVRLDGPIAEDTDTYGRTRVGAGGQAANVAAWVVALGGKASFIGKRACDAAGRVVDAEPRSRGVKIAGPVVPAGTGTVVSIATPDGKRSMLSDRGVAPDFRPHELNPAWLDGVEGLHVPGYSLTRSPIGATAIAAARLAREKGAAISVDASSTSAVAELGLERFRALVEELAPETVFANEHEVALLGDVTARELVVKRGRRGCRVVTAEGRRDYPAVAADVVDTTGAGDAFAAGFLLDGASLALDAAARCIARPGAMP